MTQNNAEQTSSVVAEAEKVLQEAAAAEVAEAQAPVENPAEPPSKPTPAFSAEDAARAGELSQELYNLFHKYGNPLVMYGLVNLEGPGFQILKAVVIAPEGKELLEGTGPHGQLMFGISRAIAMVDQLEEEGDCDCPNCTAAREAAAAKTEKGAEG